MLVLTVDLGRGVAIKREMVSGTDAAVLAAAHECAIGHTYDQANAAANAILAQNKSGAVQNGVLSAPGCGLKPTEPQLVTINTKVQMDYFFAGIFGFNSGEVGAHAVAEWGVVASGLGAPITVDHLQLANCGIPTDDPPTTQVNCQLEYPKDQLTNPRWGALDLSEWGDANAAPCHVSASDLIGIIENGGAFEPLPTPNYDCFDNGLSRLGVGVARGQDPALPGQRPRSLDRDDQAGQRRLHGGRHPGARRLRARTARSTPPTSWAGSSSGWTT